MKQKIAFTNSTFKCIDEATAGAETALNALLEQFVLPANLAPIRDAIFDLKLDTIQGTVIAAGLTWKD